MIPGLDTGFLLDFDPVADADRVARRKEQRGNTFARHAEDLAMDGLVGLPDLDFVADTRQFADSCELQHAGGDIGHGAPEAIELAGEGGGERVQVNKTPSVVNLFFN